MSANEIQTLLHVLHVKTQTVGIAILIHFKQRFSGHSCSQASSSKCERFAVSTASCDLTPRIKRILSREESTKSCLSVMNYVIVIINPRHNNCKPTFCWIYVYQDSKPIAAIWQPTFNQIVIRQHLIKMLVEIGWFNRKQHLVTH